MVGGSAGDGGLVVVYASDPKLFWLIHTECKRVSFSNRVVAVA